MVELVQSSFKFCSFVWPLTQALSYWPSTCAESTGSAWHLIIVKMSSPAQVENLKIIKIQDSQGNLYDMTWNRKIKKVVLWILQSDCLTSLSLQWSFDFQAILDSLCAEEPHMPVRRQKSSTFLYIVDWTTLTKTRGTLGGFFYG